MKAKQDKYSEVLSGEKCCINMGRAVPEIQGNAWCLERGLGRDGTGEAQPQGINTYSALQPSCVRVWHRR